MAEPVVASGPGCEPETCGFDSHRRNLNSRRASSSACRWGWLKVRDVLLGEQCGSNPHAEGSNPSVLAEQPWDAAGVATCLSSR